MFASVRRIAGALLALSVVGIALTSLSVVAFNCGTGASGCLASLYTPFVYEHVDLDPYFGNTTPGVVIETGVVLQLIQAVSGYALLIAVLVLITLECFELYYIRKILGSRKYFKFR